MRAVVAVVVLGLIACSTKPNPNRCCTDTADCEAAGISDVTPCGDNLVCRGHQCIAETCSSSSQCDLSAPFCVDMSCASMCTDDSQCPGNGGDPSLAHCVGGSCVVCRANANDCPTTAPVCDMGTCRGCAADTDCSSGACDVDAGTCIPATELVYAAPSGSSSSDCSQAAPCALDRAIATADQSRPNIKLAPGTYPDAPAFTAPFELTMYGPATMGNLTLGNNAVGNGSSLRLRDLNVSGTIACGISSGIRPQLDLKRIKITTTDFVNIPSISATLCDVTADEVTIVGPGTMYAGTAIYLSTSGGLSGSTLTAKGLWVDGADPVFYLEGTSSVSVKNSVFSNQGTGYGIIELTQSGGLYHQMGTFDFSTFYNTTLTCPTATTVFAFSNSVFLNARSGAAANTVTGSACSFRYDMIKPQSTSPGATNLLNMDPRFVDAAQGDFHLMMGSPAIDAADPAATLSTDYDGTTRPQGAGRDLGAFEYKP